MFCQICGTRIPEGRSACVQCGAPAGRVGGLTAAAPVGQLSTQQVCSCPRCGFRGTSQSYFSTGGHLALLIGLTMITGPFAILYFLLRFSHRVCPSCGLDWGRDNALALPSGEGGTAVSTPIPGDLAGMGEGKAKRVFGWMLMVFGAMLLIPGIAEAEIAAILFAGLFAGGGYLLRRSANEDRARRREAIVQSLQRPVLHLAAQRGGTLTVTEVAAEFGWSLPRAEKVLQSLEDGYRVMGDVTSEGVIVYNFLELVPNAPQELPPPQHGYPSVPPARAEATHGSDGPTG